MECSEAFLSLIQELGIQDKIDVWGQNMRMWVAEMIQVAPKKTVMSIFRTALPRPLRLLWLLHRVPATRLYAFAPQNINAEFEANEMEFDKLAQQVLAQQGSMLSTMERDLLQSKGKQSDKILYLSQR